MREPPDLPNQAIIASVRASYGIPVASLAFLPIGHDSSAWVYRAHATDGACYFLKVRGGTAYESGLVVPYYLHARGMGNIIAPRPTISGALWASLGEFALILYPYIDGHTGMEIDLNEDQWVLFGAAVKRIHATPLESDVARLVGRESFASKWGGVMQDWGAVRRLDDRVAAGSFIDAIELEVAAFWQARAAQIRTLVERAEDLSQQLRRAALPAVLCHADLHTGNVLLDSGQRLWIVDWDEAVVAPKERDLMFVVGGISRDLVGPREEELFFRGYGEVAIDPLALAYYRFAWAVQDIGAFGEQAFFWPSLGIVTRRAAADGLFSLFEHGGIVELAYESDRASA